MNFHRVFLELDQATMLFLEKDKKVKEVKLVSQDCVEKE